MPNKIMYIDSNGNLQPLDILMVQDGMTNALRTIDYAHHEVHDGSSFLTNDVQNVNTTTMKWQVEVGGTGKQPHMLFNIVCTGELYVLVTEGSDRNTGTAVAAVNRYRDSYKESTLTISRTPGGGSTDGATTIYEHRSGATGFFGTTVTAGGARADNEFILAKNTKYVIAVTTYANVYVSLNLDWYEH